MDMYTRSIIATVEISLAHVLEFVLNAPADELKKVRKAARRGRSKQDEILAYVADLDPNQHKTEFDQLVEVLNGKGYVLVDDEWEDQGYGEEWIAGKKLTPDSCVTLAAPSGRHAADLMAATILQELLERHGVERVLMAARKGGLDG